jgi:hypothetical protein
MRVRARNCVLPLALALAGCAQGAAAEADLVKLAPSKFKLAQHIGPMRFSGARKFSDRRLGRTFGYVTDGISLTIYVYDYGLRDLPEGPDSVAACEQFERARDEIENGGNYQNVTLRGEHTRRMNDTAAAPLAREALYDFQRNGIDGVSGLWLTAHDGYFIKLRLSLRREVADEFDAARTQILATVAASMAARPARRLAAAPQLPETSVELDAAAADEAAWWISYADELLRASRDDPDSMPPCGGPLLPGFAAEYAARVRALHDYHARDVAARHSPYFDDLARIDAAGFLDEYVWENLQKSGAAMPPGLDLAAFLEFRALELPRHAYFTGARVRVNRVRVLPPAD